MIIDILIATVVLWLMFIPAANLVNRYKRKELSKVEAFFGKIYVAIFLIVDVFYNYTYAAVLFWDLADNDRKTFTARLKHYLQTDPIGWRGEMAYWFCKYLIEPWDFGHCDMHMMELPPEPENDEHSHYKGNGF